jgi:hypothetical protein
MTYTNEIVLFHVRDPAPALRFSELPNETLFDLCVRSIRTRSPDSRITLLTDGATEMGNAYPDVEVIRDPALKTELLMYERARMYGEHVARRAAEPGALPLVFMDVDILVNRDLGEVFSLPFDVGLTYSLHPGIALDANDVPINTRASPINGGVIFARPTSAAAAFFKDQMARYDALHARGGFTNLMAQDIRKWGGDQFALMSMVGRALVEKRPKLVEHAGAQVRFMECDVYNYSPFDYDITEANLPKLNDKFILHMKGKRKQWMPELAKTMGIP